MMRLLNQLKEHLDEIEKEDDYAHRFITDMIIRKEENPDYKLNRKQFKFLLRIHTQYCGGR